MYQRDLAKRAEETEPVWEHLWSSTKLLGEKTKQKTLKMLDLLFIQWGGLIFILGILLGRAVLLAELFPFALPFFAAVYSWRRDKGVIAAAGIIVGTFSGAVLHGAFVLAALAIFLSVYEWVTRRGWRMTWSLPLSVLLATLGARLGTIWLAQGTVTSYDTVMASVEAGLSFVLTMIFLQSMPLLITKKRKQPLKQEEIVCFIILLASVMTGAIGWVIYGMAAEHTLARYLVLLFAYTGGAALGASVGVIAGLVLSLATIANLYQMSLLAFAGLLGGLLKEGKKIGVSIGMLLGTALIALYGDGLNGAGLTLAESAAAISLFLLTPRSVTSFIEKYIPGTPEYAREQQKHMKKMRDVTALKVEKFSNLFQTLSKSFMYQPDSLDQETEDKETDELLSKITEKTCQTCFRKERCWVNQFQDTYDGMSRMLFELERDGKVSAQMKNNWKKHCHYDSRMLRIMSEELQQDQTRRELTKKVKESRQLVAEQLRGVSEVMNDFAQEIQREKEAHHWQEEQIHEALQNAGLEIGHVDVYRLDEGNVEIEMSVLKEAGSEQAEKIIAPMLSDILKEHIIVGSQELYENISEYLNITFVSARTYTVDVGSASVAKGGGWVSGDSYASMDIGTGKHAIAISDGMGSGEKAHQESSSALQILQTILASGMDEETAIRSVNSVLSIRSTEEMFSTLDLAMVDLQEARGKFIKIGSIPSFIKRGNKIKQIEAGNLPMGMMEHADIDVVTEQMKDGDMLIMMSDGIFDIPGPIENTEIWIRRILSQIETDDPQELADLLLERVMRVSQGQIHDDMTIVTAKIKRNLPKWSAIPVHYNMSLTRKKA
ncbi:stage II sporulation protein E [Alteribacillus persepolensis]|uniref:Stage II sporulation protein E n=1 Tax=Alteribacillus persepolensis TaxID=568899 RepID=A0A1G8I0L6_9BACI|nr:stage II sporulation protein E [Alteribacillus persepolensis]SDI12414.1 stage II sporulation protein E [Alteribacillus persepolensis]